LASGVFETSAADFLEMGLVEIADADRTCLARCLQFDERAPLGKALGSAGWRMDQVQVHMVEAQPFQACVALGERLLVGPWRVTPGGIAGPKLCGHENVLAGEAG
jgi:hypothetical protein